jgi:ABC-type uncharacterized transport system auxiliary subunit
MRRAPVLSCMAIAIAAIGCLTPQDYAPLAQFTIAPDLDAIPESDRTNATVGIRRLAASQPLKRDIFYRDPGLQVGNLLDAQWAEMPGDLMTRQLLDALTASGRFVDVAYATDLSRPTFVLHGTVRRFDLDRTEDTWRAVCELRLEFRSTDGSRPAWTGTVSSTVPLAENKVDALPAAMSEAAAAVLHEAVSEITAVDPNF